MIKTSRRRFLGGSLAAAAGSLIGPAACAGRREGSGSRPLFALGLASYTFREFGLDEALAMAGRLALRRIALKDMHLPLDAPPGVIRAAIGRVKARGLEAYGCGVVYMASEAEVDRAFDYAGAGGLKVIIGVPDHALLGRAESKVRETGIRLAVHNHGPGDKRYPTPGSILERIGRLNPGIGVCLDVGHCRRSGLDPSEEALRCGPRLLDVHMKDVTAATAEGGAVEAGRGVVDIPAFLRTLGRMGYRGTVAFEYEKDGRDPLPGLAESVGYVRGVLAALAGGRTKEIGNGGSA